MSSGNPTDRGTVARTRRAVVLVGLFALMFFAGSWVVPLAQAEYPQAASWLGQLYAPACHQNPERCLTIDGRPQAVCARCAGLYLGGVAGIFVGGLLLAGRLRRVRFRWLALALAPTAIDALLPWVGLPQLTPVPRMWLAVPAGLAAGLCLGMAIAELVHEHLKKRESQARRAVAPTDGSLEVVDG